MLTESLLARSSRSLLSSRSSSLLARQALQCGEGSSGRRNLVHSQHQQNALRNWTALRVCAAASGAQPSSGNTKLSADPPAAPRAGIAKGSPHERQYATQQQSSDGGSSSDRNGGGTSVLWPLQFVLERIFWQQRDAEQQRRPPAAQQQPAARPQAAAAGAPSPTLQRIAGRRHLAAADAAQRSDVSSSRAATASGVAQDDTGSANSSVTPRSDSGGGGGGPGEQRDQENGSEGGRSMDELVAAADWQLQRAHAELRRAAEAQARQQAQPGMTDGGNGSGSSADELSLPEAGEDLLHAETARRRDSSGSDGSSAEVSGNSTAIDGQHETAAQPSGPRSTGGAATQRAPEEAVAEEPSQQQQKQQRSRSGVSTWIRLPHIPSLRRPQTPQPDLPPVPIEHPAVQLAWRRAKTGSRPGQRTDGAKLALVVEGGGMRGVISAGSLMMLYELGLRDAFDAVYGASAGAINATYFLTGQREGVDIYAEDIANKTFCDLGRLVGRHAGPVLDLSFLIDHVMMDIKPLHWHKVIGSDVPLKVVASCLDSLGPVILQDFTDKEDLALCLKASANIPVIAGPPMRHRGRRLVDGAVFEGVPFRQAIADGCTHLVVLCTRPPFRGGRMQKAMTSVLEAGVKRGFLNPDYMRPAWRAELDQITEQQMTADEQLMGVLEAERPHELPTFFGSYVAPLYPSQACHISPVCIDPPTLRGGVAEGRRLVAATFDPQDQGIPTEVLARLRPEVRAAIEAAGPQPSPFSQQQP